MRHVLAQLVWAAAAAAVWTGSPICSAEAAQRRLATFCCDVTPPLGQPIPSLRPMERIEHPLLAKGIVLDDAGQRYVLCAIDWSGICNSTYTLFCQKIAQAAGTDPARVTVHAMHLQAAPVADIDAIKLLVQAKAPPPLPDLRFFTQMADHVATAVKDSLGRLRPFDRIGAGEGKVERVASTRRVMGKDGKINPRWSFVKDLALRDEPEGLIDPMLKTITLAEGGKPLVRLHYYGCHPQSMRTPDVTYDFPGLAREALEKKEKVFQVYFSGCAGDVLVGKYNDNTPACREGLAQRLLAGMEAAIAATRLVPVEAIQWRTAEVKLPLYFPPDCTLDDNRKQMSDPKLDPIPRFLAATRIAFADRIAQPLTASSLQIGRVRILHLPGEGLIDFQLFAQRAAPADFVAVAAYGDMGTASICTDKAFQEGGAEPAEANVGPGSEAPMKAAIVKLLDGQ